MTKIIRFFPFDAISTQYTHKQFYRCRATRISTQLIIPRFQDADSFCATSTWLLLGSGQQLRTGGHSHSLPRATDDRSATSTYPTNYTGEEIFVSLLIE
jgi:hypothetical protein